MIYVFAVKTKNARIKIRKIDKDSLEDAQQEAKAIIFNSANLDDIDFDFINKTNDWNLIIKRMCDLKKPISNIEPINE